MIISIVLAFAATILQNIFSRNFFNPFAQQITTDRPLVQRPISTTKKVISTTTEKTTTSTSITSTVKTTTTTTTTRAPFVVLAQSSHTPRSIRIGDSAASQVSSASSNVLSISSEKPTIVTPRSADSKLSSTTFSPEEDAKFLTALLNAARTKNGSFIN